MVGNCHKLREVCFLTRSSNQIITIGNLLCYSSDAKLLLMNQQSCNMKGCTDHMTQVTSAEKS